MGDGEIVVQCERKQRHSHGMSMSCRKTVCHFKHSCHTFHYAAAEIDSISTVSPATYCLKKQQHFGCWVSMAKFFFFFKYCHWLLLNKMGQCSFIKDYLALWVKLYLWVYLHSPFINLLSLFYDGGFSWAALTWKVKWHLGTIKVFCLNESWLLTHLLCCQKEGCFASFFMSASLLSCALHLCTVTWLVEGFSWYK